MARLQSLLSFVLIAVLGAKAHIGPETDVFIVNKDISPDGFTRAAVVADGGVTTVGPLIIGNKAGIAYPTGDTLKLNVINQLNDPSMVQSTSIHWHGFFQEHTNWADGPSFVNQCPIPHGTSFLYEFPTRKQAGTFWYHSHVSTQYCDGLRGAIVIYDPNDLRKHLYDVDDDSTVITLADWYHTKAKTLVDPVPDSNLINGLGRYKGGPASPLAVIQVEQGKRYRFRLVNTACKPDYTFSIDQHPMTIIEADSISHEPLQVDSMRIFIGQRYSFVLNADQPVGNYWIRSDPSVGDGGFTGGLNSAILRYVGAPAEEPASDFAKKLGGTELNEADLHPIAEENPGAPGIAVPGAADVNINMRLSHSGDKFFFNDVAYESPSLPILLQVLSGARQPGELIPSGSIYELLANKTIEITFEGGGVNGFEHPIHLHGHAFDVVRVAGSKDYNFRNPVRRDVVNSGNGGDQVTFRFRTDNPGPWFMHCHIDWHIEMGLAVVFAERTDEWAENIAPPAAWQDLCPAYAALGPDEL